MNSREITGAEQLNDLIIEIMEIHNIISVTYSGIVPDKTECIMLVDLRSKLQNTIISIEKIIGRV
jgi:hypothetical protein